MTAKKKYEPKAKKSGRKKVNPEIADTSSKKGARPISYPDFDKCRLQMNTHPLTDEQRQEFDKRLKDLDDVDIDIIYRGDKKDKLLGRFNIHPDSFPILFNDYLFMIGDKGRHFWNEEKRNRRWPHIPVFLLENTSREFLELIFDLLRSIFIKKDYPDPLQIRLKEFTKDNKQFIRFFRYKKNKEEFVTKILSENVFLAQKARDYYLTILHQFGKNGFYETSFLLSTTRKFRVAKNFIRWERSENNGIVLMGWLSRKQVHSLYTQFRTLSDRIRKEIELPTINMEFYKEQHEVTLKGGLLPHFIIGYFYWNKGMKCFEVNPAFLDIKDREWYKHGLYINQTYFRDYLNKTNFKKGFMVTPSDGYMEI